MFSHPTILALELVARSRDTQRSNPTAFPKK